LVVNVVCEDALLTDLQTSGPSPGQQYNPDSDFTTTTGRNTDSEVSMFTILFCACRSCSSTFRQISNRRSPKQRTFCQL